MIDNYNEPALLVYQEIDRVDFATLQGLSVLLVGVDKYSVKYGRDKLESYADYAGVAFPYIRTNALGETSVLGSEYTVDAATVKAFAHSGAEAFITSSDLANAKWPGGAAPKTHLKFGVAVSGESFDGTTLVDEVRPGDYVIITASNAPSKILRVLSIYSTNTIVLDSTYGTDADAYSGVPTTHSVKVFRKGEFQVTAIAGAVTVTMSAPLARINGAAAMLRSYGSVSFEYSAQRNVDADNKPVRAYSGTDYVSKNPESELGYAAHCALLGSGNRAAVYVLRTAGDTAADFEEALKAVENTDSFYALVPVTTNASAVAVVSEHAKRMALPENKIYRKVYAGADNMEEISIEDAVAAAAAVTASNTLTIDPTELGSLAGFEIQVGDVLSTDSGVLGTVIGRNEALERPDSEIWLDTAVTLSLGDSLFLTKVPTAAAIARDLVAQAQALDNPRCSIIWTSAGTNAEYPDEVLANRFLASFIAGQRVVTPPQLGLTRTGVEALVASAPDMYTKFDKPTLNEMAANGIWIVTQEYENGPIFTRHQLTTGTEGGALEYEDSPLVAYDIVTKAMRDATDPFIGKFNGSDDSMRTLRKATQDALAEFTVPTPEEREFGPVLLGYSNFAVGMHPVLKDNFLVNADLTFALPLNRGVVTLRATV